VSWKKLMVVFIAKGFSYYLHTKLPETGKILFGTSPVLKQLSAKIMLGSNLNLSLMTIHGIAN